MLKAEAPCGTSGRGSGVAGRKWVYSSSLEWSEIHLWAARGMERNKGSPRGQQGLSTQQRTCSFAIKYVHISLPLLSPTLRGTLLRTTGMTRLLTLASSKQSLEGAARPLCRRQGSETSASHPERTSGKRPHWSSHRTMRATQAGF